MRTKMIKSEVVKLFNTTKETLRYYEQAGLLKPEVSYNNYRFYGFEDLAQLRKIFLLRDLGISVEEMKELDDGRIEEDEYTELLKQHQVILQNKIQRLQSVQKSLQQIVNIHEHSDNHYSYQVVSQPKRHFYLFESFDAEDIVSPKAYFDRYSDLINSEDYSERTLQMLYHFDALSSGESIRSKQCIELSGNRADRLIKSSPQSFYVLPPGSYLSVFYPFKHGGEVSLPALKLEIERYLQANKLSRVDTMVLETERPELSMFIDKQTSVYEMQILVEKE